MNSKKSYSHIDNHNLIDVIRKEEPLYDYSKLHTSASSYDEYSPTDKTGIQLAILSANKKNQQIRVRGGGHSMSGISLPQQDELLIRTRGIEHYRFEEVNTTTVGAGALVWDVRDFVRGFGLELPIFHGGWAGVTVGGYINAGGLGDGRGSEIYGGFWENVIEITFIDGTGRTNVIHRCDPFFPWLFGTSGQFGVIVEAKLLLTSSYENIEAKYPLGRTGLIPRCQKDDPVENDTLPSPETKLVFFTLSVSPDQQAKAWEMIDHFFLRHGDWLTVDGGWAGPIHNGQPIGYHYIMKFHNFNPPFVYPKNESFIVMGLMGLCKVGDKVSDERLMEASKEFNDTALENGFRLYVQAENIANNINLKEYFGDAIYEQYLFYKNIFDPRGLMNAHPSLSEPVAAQKKGAPKECKKSEANTGKDQANIMETSQTLDDDQSKPKSFRI